MTGLDVERDHVVEICIERVVGGVREAGLATLVRPPARIGGAAEVHGIDAHALEGAPAYSALAPEVAGLLQGAVLVAHAAVWDVDFLTAESRRAGQALAIPFFVDTLTLARRVFAQQSYSLDSLCASLGIERGQAHRAESDVRALRGLFDRCVASLAPVSARDLWQVRIGTREARPAIVDACEAAAKHGAPVLVTFRPRRRPAENLVLVVREVRSDLDPPRVLGYQLPGRGRRELRADRILRVEPYAEPTPAP
jgi:DNA polymerase-3 subunit epsilon